MIEVAIAVLLLAGVIFALVHDPDPVDAPVSLESGRDSRVPSSIGDLEPRPDLQRRRR